MSAVILTSLLTDANLTLVINWTGISIFLAILAYHFIQPKRGGPSFNSNIRIPRHPQPAIPQTRRR